MDRNSIIGFVLIFLVIMLWQMNSMPSEEEAARLKAERDSIAQIERNNDIPVISENQSDIVENREDTETGNTISQVIPDSIKQAEAQKKYGVFANSASGQKQTEPIVIENEKMKVGLNPTGGGIDFVELKEYVTHDSLPVLLWDSSDQFELVYSPKSGGMPISLAEFDFDPSSNGFSITGNDQDHLTMTLNGSDSRQKFEIDYALTGNSYDLVMDVRLSDLEATINMAQPIMLNWRVKGDGKEKSISTEEQFTALHYKEKDDDPDDLGKDDLEDLSTTEWVAFKQYFFSAIAYSDQNFLRGYNRVASDDIEEENKTFHFQAELALPIVDAKNGNTQIEFYLGPNHYQTLKTYDRDYEEVINLGWGIFGWMNEWIVIPLFNFLDDFISSYGIIILILTIIIKLALSPLTYKNYLSSAKQKVLKPEIDALNEQYKDADPMKKQQAVMGLYRKTGVNPMAGCVPMLIQLPILYAMFRFFPASIELRQKSFLWADDLSSYDSIFQWTAEIPFISSVYGNHISLFTLLMALSTLIYTLMNSSQMPTQPGLPNMKIIMVLFPIMMLFFFNKFASGLSYYYLLANMFSMGQMYVIKNYVIDQEKIKKQIAANKKKPTKKSRFQKRLEEVAKQRGYQMPRSK